MDNAFLGKGRTEDLKLLIVSTPKTGNTWIKHLLATIYDLPKVKVGGKFDIAEVSQLGPRWIAHQHFRSRPDILEWAEQNNVFLVTTIRHPGDVLVSLFHYVQNFEHIFPSGHKPLIMRKDGDKMGEHTITYLTQRDHFRTALDVSLNWMRSGKTLVVRYEDLQQDPVATLQVLTASIRAVPVKKITRAVEQCNIDNMRKLSERDAKFFREGKTGGWKQALPEEVLAILRTTDPYPVQCAALGYSLDTGS